MAKHNLICSLDIGTYSTRAIVGEIDRDGGIHVIGIGQCRSSGLKKGAIIDIDATVRGITEAVGQAERMIGEEIGSVYVAIGGSNTTLTRNRGTVAIQGEDREVSAADVERVLQSAQVLAIPPEKEIINVRPITYVVDGYDGIKDPVGMIGVRLEVDALIITGRATYLQNIRRCVERANLEVSGLVLKGLATGFSALSPDERELGCALIDIGAGVTEISLFKNDCITHFLTLPQGGDLITHDLAHGLRVPYAQAEQIKLTYGAAVHEAARQNIITVESVGSGQVTEVDTANLVEYIQPRVEEIFDFVRNEIIRAGFREPPGGGIILTGGVSQLPGIDLLAEQKLGTSVRLYKPPYIGVNDPTYTASTSVLYYMAGLTPGAAAKPRGNSGRRLLDWFRAQITEMFG